MGSFQKARTLAEVARVIDQRPLEYGDPRYVDLSKGRGSVDLRQLRVYLRDHDAAQNQFAKALFTGHRGCGKTTELYRVMHDLRDQFTPMMLVASDVLLGDYDYTDLLLWLVDQLVGQFRDEFRRPLDARLVADTEQWFAEVTREVIKDVKSELTVATEAEAQAKFGWFGTGIKLLGRLKSMIVGSVQRRQTIRRELQSYVTDLITRVNLLLDDAQDKLGESGRPPNLLIVVDNLDRLGSEGGRRLFQEHGDLLLRLRAHFVYTVPIALVLAPLNVGRTFPHTSTLPMVMVRGRDGKECRPGVGALLEVLDQRLDRKAIFASDAVAKLLARMSGGSMSDLIRLVDGARLAARANGKEKIDKASAEGAITKLRIEYQRILTPGQAYYPLLAKVHQTHEDWFESVAEADPQKVRAYRMFFSELLFNGAVLEYDGGVSWYDVHPVIEQLDGFRRALDDVQAKESP